MPLEAFSKQNKQNTDNDIEITFNDYGSCAEQQMHANINVTVGTRMNYTMLLCCCEFLCIGPHSVRFTVHKHKHTVATYVHDC